VLKKQQQLFAKYWREGETLFAKSPEVKSVVNKASKYLHVLIYDIVHTGYKLLGVFKL